jgi:hypothetical protein
MTMMGEFLKQTPKATGGEHGGKAKLDGSRNELSNPTPTLADAGISKRESSDAQLLAKGEGGELPARATRVKYSRRRVKIRLWAGFISGMMLSRRGR